MKSTGFDTDLAVYTPQTIKRFTKDTTLYQLPNGRKIRLLNMIGEMKCLDEHLSHCREEELGEEKGRYLLEGLEDMKRASKEKGDKRTVLLADKILGKYEYLRKEKKISVKQVRELKGMPAFRGKVKGKVRIILGKGDKIGKIEKREILVTKMTSAKFASILGKIKAIVTDDGGRLCHAAILSREYKIPCIVGTKIATRVLRDGDLIEVDAEKGIVRIFKRGK